MQDEAGAPLTAAEPTPPDPGPVTPERRRRLRVRLVVVAAVVLVLDQATKAWALAALTPGHPVDVHRHGDPAHPHPQPRRGVLPR